MKDLGLQLTRKKGHSKLLLDNKPLQQIELVPFLVFWSLHEILTFHLKTTGRLRAQLVVGGSDAKAAAAALRRLAAAEDVPPPLHLVAATPGRLRALLALGEAPLNMCLVLVSGRKWAIFFELSLFF